VTATVLFATITTNENTPGVQNEKFGEEDRRRAYTVYVVGTFGGATVALQTSPDNGTSWVALKDVNGNAVSFTSAGAAVCNTQATEMRAAISGGTSASLSGYVL
jgi:hypothetical protein